MRQKFLTYIFLISVFSSYAQLEENPGGLLFTSSQEKVDQRTSLVLFGDNLQQFQDSFKLSFDLSILDVSQFGHVFRIINNKRQELEFVFVNFFGLDNMYLDFHSPITHQSVKIPILEEDIDSKKVIHLDFDFNLVDDEVVIHLEDTFYVCETVGLENPSTMKFAFGIFGLNLDVPQMLIKNIQIKDYSKSFIFPLNESEGNYAYDTRKKYKAVTKNPNWIINNHHYWQEKIYLELDDDVSISYDDDENRIIIVNKENLLSYCPRYGVVEQIPLNVETNASLLDVIYNPIHKNYCLFYDGNQNLFLDSAQETKLNLSLHHADTIKAIHYNSFISATGEIYQFGGYANHLYYNHILKYQPDIGEWTIENFKGDLITPRFYSSVGKGVNKHEVLLYGGFGNETGRQEHGGRNLYDLYKIDLNSKEIHKLWNLNEVFKNEFIAGENIILNESKTHFYALCYAHHKPNTTGFIYRFNLKDGSHEIISDTLHFHSEGMNTSVKLFYNQLIKEFYVVIKEIENTHKTKVIVYSIAAPPISYVKLKSTQNSNLVQWRYYFLVVLIALILIVLIVSFYHSRNKTRKNKREFRSRINVNTQNKEKTHKHSAVYIFGDFTVYDRKGKDISYRFSSKIRTLFALILLHTHDETGISTENLTTNLWPEKELNEAKNIRGVTINRLRNILNEMEGIKLIHQNHQWFFMYDNAFYCDYLEYLQLLEKIHHESDANLLDELMILFTEIISRGNILSNMQDIGIDEFKSKEEEKIAVLLKEYILQLYKEKKYNEAVQLVSVYFKIDPINEEVLNIGLKSYRKLGKQDEARVFLNRYKKTYEMLTGEEFISST